MISLQEAIDWLFVLQRILADDKQISLCWDVEDVRHRLISGFSKESLQAYSEYLLPKGKRGRVWLVLDTPYRARALALLVGIMRNIT